MLESRNQFADYLLNPVLEDGALGPVLSVCTHSSPAPALLALMTLSHIAESAATHEAIVDSPKQALPRILSLTASEDEQVSQRSLCDHNFASRVMLRGSVKVQCSYMSVSNHIAIILQVGVCQKLQFNGPAGKSKCNTPTCLSVMTLQSSCR